MLLTGARLLGRAVSRATQEEFRASQQAAQQRSSDQSQGRQSVAKDYMTGMSLDEAKLILNVEDINDKEKLVKNYDYLFEANSKTNGGNLYIQSKVHKIN